MSTWTGSRNSVFEILEVMAFVIIKGSHSCKSVLNPQRPFQAILCPAMGSKRDILRTSPKLFSWLETLEKTMSRMLSSVGLQYLNRGSGFRL